MRTAAGARKGLQDKAGGARGGGSPRPRRRTGGPVCGWAGQASLACGAESMSTGSAAGSSGSGTGAAIGLASPGATRRASSDTSTVPALNAEPCETCAGSGWSGTACSPITASIAASIRRKVKGRTRLTGGQPRHCGCAPQPARFPTCRRAATLGAMVMLDPLYPLVRRERPEGDTASRKATPLPARRQILLDSVTSVTSPTDFAAWTSCAAHWPNARPQAKNKP